MRRVIREVKLFEQCYTEFFMDAVFILYIYTA